MKALTFGGTRPFQRKEKSEEQDLEILACHELPGNSLTTYFINITLQGRCWVFGSSLHF